MVRENRIVFEIEDVVRVRIECLECKDEVSKGWTAVRLNCRNGIQCAIPNGGEATGTGTTSC